MTKLQKILVTVFSVVVVAIMLWAASINGVLTVTFSPGQMTYGLSNCMANGTVGVAYTCNVQINGGVPPYKMVPGTGFPAGFTITPNATKGGFDISGTYTGAPNVPVNFPFTVCDSQQATCP